MAICGRDCQEKPPEKKQKKQCSGESSLLALGLRRRHGSRRGPNRAQ
eukprot:CAMPEP_0168452366 /NCGR_PEP_ID=MMETSP0228-20121227/49115_1 /TAXON_ID=133427 /ORGANISM="Protoceratium reticulatum, Strain CCCM 535 (=CCMP 1889)" /LENGTH=46 /DNA_ID= /DNA_START= /DNA_END= /DNA_ORIENTATION=